MTKNVNSSAVCNDAHNGKYVSPEVKVVLFESEGILCSSVEGASHEEFTLDDEYEL